MTELRLIHSSDLRLGKRFARFQVEISGCLTEARHGILGKMARAVE